MEKLTYLGNLKPKNYYQSELNRIDNLSNIKIKVCDNTDNSTKWIDINKESIIEIENFLTGIKILLED